MSIKMTIFSCMFARSLIRTQRNVLVLIGLFLFFGGQTYVSADEYSLAEIDFMQDEPSLQRGAIIYHNTCRVCHGMKFIRYKNFMDIGFTKEQIDKLRGKQQVNATLTKTVKDNVLTDYYGQVPPDLSLMAKARKNGPRYIYTLLTSYTYSEKDGVYNNTLFEDIKMPDIMNISTAEEDSHIQAIHQDVKDVSEFLLWASDPHAAERKNTGYFVVGYFIILSLLLYFVMKRTWSKLD
ncbi:MAG: cytochrome c1 [Thiohalomonadales bacterium]